MPTSDMAPGSGITAVASAQVLYRRDLILRDELSPFGPTALNAAGARAQNIRNEATLDIQNLDNVFIHLFLFPTYEEGGVVYTARNNIEWRPVFYMPPDSFPDTDGVASHAPSGTDPREWLPFTAPSIVPVGLPIYFTVPAGVESISIEVRAPIVQGQTYRERLLVSLSASQ
jgi:hypothetical protein